MGNGPRSVALTDLNGDGQLDLVTASEYSDTAVVRLGERAPATFGAPVSYAVGTTRSRDDRRLQRRRQARRGGRQLHLRVGFGPARRGNGTLAAAKNIAVAKCPQGIT